MEAGVVARARGGAQGGCRDQAQGRARHAQDRGPAGQVSGAAADGALPGAVVRAAPAKLNLTLRVVGRRADGYHELDSVVAFTRLGDVVRAQAADDITLALDGPFASALANAGAAADNLVLRAAHALASAAGAPRGARLTLTKNLPIASGIGGGSADAAATLQALSALWGTMLERRQLHALGLALGADVPVCLNGAPCRMQGIGETLTPLAGLPAAPILLVNPGVPLATAAVFRARTAAFSTPLDMALAATPAQERPDGGLSRRRRPANAGALQVIARLGALASPPPAG
ncbi:MAG: 4-(cytidine 5'-diphospho)-2-C-methyl-D-erythritol kinase [Proteobacteria bacterium]|nr:4-(cytidine 5'-diphospho)-2-C-methyl-D-erythritol kinase [Pseudomonadota bacterium]